MIDTNSILASYFKYYITDGDCAVCRGIISHIVYFFFKLLIFFRFVNNFEWSINWLNFFVFYAVPTIF